MVDGEKVDLDRECFYIAPIGHPGSEERKRSDGVLKFIVARAADELELHAIRADAIADPGQITLQVIAHLIGAKAAVADLTGRNPNVFYELAIRHAANLPVVQIAETGENLPFDIAQMRTIFVDHKDLESADQCRKEIVEQLRRGVAGAHDSPVSAAVDLKNLQGGSPVERSLAELVTAVEQMARRQQDLERMIEVNVLGGAARETQIGVAQLQRILDVLDATSDWDSNEEYRSVRREIEYFLRQTTGSRVPPRGVRPPSDVSGVTASAGKGTKPPGLLRPDLVPYTGRHGERSEDRQAGAEEKPPEEASKVGSPAREL